MCPLIQPGNDFLLGNNYFNVYSSNLNPFPIPGGPSNVYEVTPDGSIKVDVGGLNTVPGLVIDQQARMENSMCLIWALARLAEGRCCR